MLVTVTGYLLATASLGDATKNCDDPISSDTFDTEGFETRYYIFQS
jgi:hypothetical protein